MIANESALHHWRPLCFGAMLFLAMAAALCAASNALAQPRFSFASTPGALPKEAIASRYRLALQVDPARDDFSGEVSIAVHVSKPMPALVVHAHKLTAKTATLLGAGTARPLTVTVDRATQMWRLAPADGLEVPAGDLTLEIAYSGAVQRAGEGLYRAEYHVRDQPIRMLATQLASVEARTVFPSFDEPAFRAVFEIAIRAPAEYDVVSNMPLASEVADGPDAVHRFAPSPSMPTYLVALAVGRFDALSDESAGVALRILTAEGKRDQARYAMEVTKKVLPFYASYFGLAYALPKLDQLAVPSTRVGAMEDWGLISYEESTVLFDPTRSSPDTERRVFGTMAHEIAHQWFGNLVTHASWDEIWLNEAFATWLATKTTAHFNPAWHIPLRQRLSVDRSMARDAGDSTRAIRSGPVSETSVADVLDDITYVKGGAVLGMLEQWIGPDGFQRGLAAYIAGQRLSNATAGDLWHYMSEATRQDVRAVAASWTDQPGLPVVRVRSRCVNGKTRVTLEQLRFSVGSPAPTTQLWKIPVRLARGAQATTHLLESAVDTVELAGCVDAPLIVNAGGKGFFRVEYEPARLRSFARSLEQLAPEDKVTLLSDTFALAQAGRVPMASYFSLLSSIPKVKDASRAALFAMASRGLSFLDAATAGTPAQLRVRAAGRSLLAPELTKLTWTPHADDDAEAKNLRAALILQLAHFDDAATIAQARQLYDADEAGQAPLPGSIRSAVIGAVGVHADRARFDRLLARLKAAQGDEDRRLYAEALASGRDPIRAGELMNTALAGIVPPNVASDIPGMVGSTSPLGELAYDFTLANWPALAGLAGNQFAAKYWLLPNAAWQFNDQARAAKLAADQRRIAGPDGDSPAARAVARIELLSLVRQRDAAALERQLTGWRPQRGP